MRLKRLAWNETGAVNVVVLALIFPLILYLGYNGIMNAHLADVKGTMETAASVAARDYAGGGTVAHAQLLAYDVVTGSLPTGGTFTPTTPSNSGALSGVLSYTGGNYYITSMSGVATKVKPADSTVGDQLSSLVGQDVTATGNYVTVPQKLTLSYITSQPAPTQTVNETTGQNDSYIGNTQTVSEAAAGGVQATPNQTLTQTTGTGGSGSGGSQTVGQTIGSWQPGQALTVSQANGVQFPWGQGPWGTGWGDSHLSGSYWVWSHQTDSPNYPVSYGEQANFSGGFYAPQPWTQYTLYTDGDDTSTSWYSFSDSTGNHSGSASSAGTVAGSVAFNVQNSPSTWLEVTGTAQNNYGPAGYISALVAEGPYYTTAYTVPTGSDGAFYNHYPGFSVPISQYVTISDPGDAGNPNSMWVDDWTTVANNEGNGGSGGGGNPITFYAAAGQTYSVDIWGWSHNYNLEIQFSSPESVFGTNGNWLVTDTTGVNYNPVTLPTTIAPGATVTVPVTVTNSDRTNDGNFTWPDDNASNWANIPQWANPVRVSYHWLQNGQTVVWDGNRGSLPYNVAPGQSATVNLQVTAPSTPGTYQLQIDTVEDAVMWFGGNMHTNVVNATINVQRTTYGVHYSPATVPTVMNPGPSYSGHWTNGLPGVNGQPLLTDPGPPTYNVSVTLENTSDFTWPSGGSNPVHLSYHWFSGNAPAPGQDQGDTANPIWDGNRAALPFDLPPGQSTTLTLPVVPPSQPGTYTLQLDLVQEGVTWFGANDGASEVNVPVTIPSGQEMTGQLTQDAQGNYWIGTTEVLPNGQDVAPYLNKNVAAWGTITPADSYFLATDVEVAQNYNNGLSAGTQYDPNLDASVYTETVNGVQYAVAQVRYHYPVLIPTLPMLLNSGASPLDNSETVYGTAKFILGT